MMPIDVIGVFIKYYLGWGDHVGGWGHVGVGGVRWSCRGGVAKAGVGGSCRGGVGHVGVGWVMYRWGGSCRGGGGSCSGGWVM